VAKKKKFNSINNQFLYFKVVNIKGGVLVYVVVNNWSDIKTEVDQNEEKTNLSLYFIHDS